MDIYGIDIYSWLIAALALVLVLLWKKGWLRSKIISLLSTAAVIGILYYYWTMMPESPGFGEVIVFSTVAAVIVFFLKRFIAGSATK